jgi:hypothetical protein
LYQGAVRCPWNALAVLAPWLLLAACASAPRRLDAEAEARAALLRFAAAVDAGRWKEAWALLSARWRARSTPASLERDFRESGPVGAEAVARVRALLDAGARLRAAGREATLAVGEGRAARLAGEEGGWRVERIE